MPRKAKMMPIPRIEGLSTGQRMDIAKTFVDDFDGTTHAVVQPPMPSKPPPSYNELNAPRVARKQAVVQGIVGLLEQVRNPPQVEVMPEGKRKLSEIADKAVLIDAKPWRRM